LLILELVAVSTARRATNLRIDFPSPAEHFGHLPCSAPSQR